MARSKKKTLLNKFTSWIKGSIEKFAAEGFSKKGLKKRSQAVPSFLKIRKKKKAAAKTKTAKRAPVKKAKSKKSTPAKKQKPAAVFKIKTKSVKFVNKPNPKKTMGVGMVKVKPAKAFFAVKPSAVAAKPAPGIFVGKITHYFPKAGAAVLMVEKTEIKAGAKILIHGANTSLKMTAKSIQINRIPVPSGKPGEDVGIGVPKPVVVGDSVYLV